MTQIQGPYRIVQSAKPARAFMITRGEARIDVIVCKTYTNENGVLIAKVYSVDDELKRVFEIRAERIHVESL